MRILYTFLLLAISMIAHAQNTIAIYQKDGKVAKFAFTEKPVITYADNNLVLTTSQTSVQYPIAEDRLRYCRHHGCERSED